MPTIHLVARPAASGRGSSAIAGHALISIYDGNNVYVVHFMGGTGSTNPVPIVVMSVINATNNMVNVPLNAATTVNQVVQGHFTTVNQYTAWLTARNVVETPGLPISQSLFLQIIGGAIQSAAGTAGPHSLPATPFNVVLGALGFRSLGTNCMTWAYQFLWQNGITLTWTAWAKSFYSPRQAVEAQHALVMR